MGWRAVAAAPRAASARTSARTSPRTARGGIRSAAVAKALLLFRGECAFSDLACTAVPVSRRQVVQYACDAPSVQYTDVDFLLTLVNVVLWLWQQQRIVDSSTDRDSSGIMPS